MRLWRVCKQAGRPWPTLDDDDVIDYLVMEAVAVKASEIEREAEKEQEVDKWRQESVSKLEAFR